MSERTPHRLLPLPTETSHITRRKPPPVEREQQPKQQHLPQHTCSNPNCAAQKILSTPELLENILIHLPTKTLLPLQLVSSTWHTLITTSPTLRLHPFLEPQWQRPTTSFLLLPCTSIPGLQIRPAEPVHLGQWIEVKMTPQAAQSIGTATTKTTRPPNLNPFRSQKPDAYFSSQPYPPVATLQPANLLIAQPPIIGMQAFIVNPHNPHLPTPSSDIETTSSFQQYSHPDSNFEPGEITRARWKIACDAGITLGFMADVARRLVREYREGLDGGLREERQQQQKEEEEGKGEGEGGDVVVVVVFRAIVSFCSQTDIAPRMRSGTRFVTGVD